MNASQRLSLDAVAPGPIPPAIRRFQPLFGDLPGSTASRSGGGGDPPVSSSIVDPGGPGGTAIFSFLFLPLPSNPVNLGTFAENNQLNNCARDWTGPDKCASPLSIVVFGRCLAWEREKDYCRRRRSCVGVGTRDWPTPVISGTAGARDARPGNKDLSEFSAAESTFATAREPSGMASNPVRSATGARLSSGTCHPMGEEAKPRGPCVSVPSKAATPNRAAGGEGGSAEVTGPPNVSHARFTIPLPVLTFAAAGVSSA